MTTDQAIALISCLLTVASFCANIIQYKERKSLIQRLRSFAQDTYMNHYMIARACTRLRFPSKKPSSLEEVIDSYSEEVNYINGFADAARNTIVAVAQYQLGFTPKFIHPAYPEITEFDDQVKMGQSPAARKLELGRVREGLDESKSGI